MLSRFSCVRLFATLWTVAHQAPLSMGFSRQEYFSGLPCPPPGNLPNPGSEIGSPSLQADSLPGEPPGEVPHASRNPLSLWQSDCPHSLHIFTFQLPSVGQYWPGLRTQLLSEEKPETQKEVICPRTYTKLVLCQISKTERKESLRGPHLLGVDEKMRWEVKHRKHIGVAGRAYLRSRWRCSQLQTEQVWASGDSATIISPKDQGTLGTLLTTSPPPLFFLLCFPSNSFLIASASSTWLLTAYMNTFLEKTLMGSLDIAKFSCWLLQWCHPKLNALL